MFLVLITTSIYLVVLITDLDVVLIQVLDRIEAVVKAKKAKCIRIDGVNS